MKRTFTLSNTGFIDPRMIRENRAWEVCVEHPRRITVENLALTLRDNEPDLPIGSTVRVWLDQWFRCETLEYIAFKEAERERQRLLECEHAAQIEAFSQTTFLHPTHMLLSTSPVAAQLTAHLNHLYKAQESYHHVYKAYWHARDPEGKQKSNDAYSVSQVIVRCIAHVSEYVLNQLTGQGIQAQLAYAYSPREGARDGSYSPGRDHLQLLSPVYKGRFKRDAYDALCKPASKFWGLQGFGDKRVVTCKECLTKMIMLID